MSGCFLAGGRWLLSKISPGGPAAQPFSPLEGFACSWLIGSWACSTLWFFLGTAGFFNPKIAVAMISAGLLWAAFQIPKVHLPSLRPKLRFAAESLIILWVLGTAVLMVAPQTYWDTLSFNMALPSGYAALGRFQPNIFNLYSYFAQNQELLSTWALLAGSKEAAFLQMWGFWAVLLVFVYGFLSRAASRTAALIAVGLFLSTPLSTFLAVHIKNDLQVGLFLMMQWWALIFSLEKSEKGGISARRWIFLAGFFAGAAYGMKMSAMPSIAVTALGIALFMRPRAVSLGIFSLGFAAAAGHWLVRNVVLFKNPFYPFFNSLAGTDYIYPWHHHFMTEFRLMSLGWPGLLQYAENFTRFFPAGPFSHAPYWWGPSAILCLAGLACLSPRHSPAVRKVTVLVLASWLFTMMFALKPIHQLGPLLFFCMISFGLGLHAVIKSSVRLRFGTAAAVVTALILKWLFYANKIYLLLILTAFITGAPVWHYVRTLQTDLKEFASIDEIEWVHELVDRHTQKEDVVLFMGGMRSYGIRRRNYSAMSWGQQPVYFFAEKAKDEKELRDILWGLGIRHILAEPRGWNYWAGGDMVDEPYRHGIPVERSELIKISRFMGDYTVQRFSVPSGGYQWFSILPPDGAPLPKMEFTDEDVYEFPQHYAAMCRKLQDNGESDEASRILNALEHHVFPARIEAQIQNLPRRK